MKQTMYPRLRESVWRKTLANGLTVAVIPRPGFSKKMAYFVTDFGSVHTEFRLEGKDYCVPAGIAHYLEHKMFDLPGRDVSAELAELGANVNAFTSYDMTAYHFSCTNQFEACLKLLLEFVSTAYFTAESVEKEQGIIDQEIGMNLDAPDSVVFERLMEGMYRRHPIRVPILGTSDSIRQITPELLELCHRAFYTPGNMILCVMGDVDPEQVASIAEEQLGSEPKPVAQKLRPWNEEMHCVAPVMEARMEVAMPTYQLGFKCEPIGTGGFETVDGCAMLLCGGDGHDPKAVRDAIVAQAAVLAQQGIGEQELLRMKRSALGRRIRDLDSFDSTCFRLCAYHFTGYDYFDFPAVYESVREEEILELLRSAVTEERCCLSVIAPLK